MKKFMIGLVNCLKIQNWNLVNCIKLHGLFGSICSIVLISLKDYNVKKHSLINVFLNTIIHASFVLVASCLCFVFNFFYFSPLVDSFPSFFCFGTFKYTSSYFIDCVSNQN